MVKKIKEKNKKKNYTSSQSVKSEYTNMLQITGLVFAIFLAFYFITVLVTKKIEAPVNEEVKIQYDNILVGEILNRPETEYYVLVTDSKDANDLYRLYVSYYEEKENNLRTYYVNLDEGLNKQYVADTSLIMVNDLSKIRFKDATLVHVKDKKIDRYYEGKEQIVIQYENLIK